MILIWRCAQIVNGTKKWITNGIDSDYFVTMVRTGKGFSVLLIPRCEGLETKPIKTSYSASAGTAFITYDNVKVPVENILGQEKQGMRVILSNFNHERWGMSCTFLAPSHLHVRCAKNMHANRLQKVLSLASAGLLWKNV